MDRKLWALTYACIERFHCRVIFKHSVPNVPNKVNCRIEFFVPSEHPSASEVVQFLMAEMEHEAHPPSNGKDGWFWATDVYVREYSGLRAYVDHAEIRALTMRVLSEMGHEKKA